MSTIISVRFFYFLHPIQKSVPFYRLKCINVLANGESTLPFTANCLYANLQRFKVSFSALRLFPLSFTLSMKFVGTFTVIPKTMENMCAGRNIQERNEKTQKQRTSAQKMHLTKNSIELYCISVKNFFFWLVQPNRKKTIRQLKSLN